MPNIIIKNYEHFNRSLPNWDSSKGKYIKNKDHYDSEMKKAGMVQVDQAGQVGKPTLKDYKLSDKARAILQTVKQSADSKGRVKLSDRTIQAMKEIGAIKTKSHPMENNLPGGKGGFY